MSRALAALSAPAPAPPAGEGALEPLARPEPGDEERQAAARGELSEAEPRITEGSSLPLAGALVILPALAATGLLEAVASVFRPARAAFYGLRSLVLTIVFAALVGEPRAEGLTRLGPVDLGRLLGLDRAPEVRCLRARLAKLAGQGRSAALLEALARRHVEASTPGWPTPVVAAFWCGTPSPGASLVGELRRVASEVRALVGPDARPTIIFDRGGWRPKLFAELQAAGFHIATYRKAPKAAEPRSAFVRQAFVDDLGRTQGYWLADRKVRLAYDSGRRRFACRQITRLDPATGHQAQVITTRDDPDPAPLAQAMFSRWRQENFFRYTRALNALNALNALHTTPPCPTTSTASSPTRPARRPTPRWPRPKRPSPRPRSRGPSPCRGPAQPRRRQEDGRRLRGRPLRAGGHRPDDPRQGASRGVPPRGGPPRPRTQTHPRRRPHTHLQRRVRPRPRPGTPPRPGRGRSPQPPAGGVRLARRPRGHRLGTPRTDQPTVAPRRNRTLAAPCEDLTATETAHPSTDLVLVYSIKKA